MKEGLRILQVEGEIRQCYQSLSTSTSRVKIVLP